MPRCVAGLFCRYVGFFDLEGKLMEDTLRWPLTTRQTAEVLGVKTGTLAKAATDGRLDLPEIGSGFRRQWSFADFEKACRLFRRQPPAEVLVDYARRERSRLAAGGAA